MVDKFVMDMRNYAALVSDSTSPSLIIMFGVSEFFSYFLANILVFLQKVSC